MMLDGALSIALPELILSVGVLALLATGAFLGDKGTRLIAGASGCVLVAAAVAALLGPQGSGFHGGFVEDAASVYAKAGCTA
jgi:NADH-quinone oxidoreductase subunit N